jgi:hypothetical protein
LKQSPSRRSHHHHAVMRVSRYQRRLFGRA